MLTGRSAESLGALWNYDGALPVGGLSPDTFTWSRALQQAGFRTGFVGKWHASPTHGPLDFGFHEYTSQSEIDDLIRSKGWSPPPTEGWLGADDPNPVEQSRTHLLAERAAGLVGKFSAEAAPWHVRLDFSEPHLPCRPAGRFAGMYRPEEIPRWGSFDETFRDKPYIQRQQLESWGIGDMTWKDWAPAVARYYGVVSQLDDAIGKVLKALDESGAAENTIVVFTSDHGDLCGSHRMIDKHYVMYDDVVRVPLIIRWPGTRSGGHVESGFVSSCLDIGPTLLDCAGISCDTPMHGRSFAELLKNGAMPAGWREEIVATYNGAQFGLFCQRMIRTDRWKYIWNPTDTDELYDMERDPNEMVNLIRERRSIAGDLAPRLYRILSAQEDRLVANGWTKAQLLEGRRV